MSIKTFKYCAPLLVYLGSLQAFFSQGVPVWIPVIYAWIIIPLLELFIKPDSGNLSAAEEELVKNDRSFDLFLYMIVPLQYLALGCFLWSVTYQQQSWIDITGKVFVMGLLCGTFGINVGHELGHRSGKSEQLLAKLLLLSSLYMHFFIEHNKGHHKRVATPHDPASARYNEWLYAFYFRSIIFSYFSAWQISMRDMKKKDYAALSWRNEMLWYHIIQVSLVASLWFFFGWMTALLFMAAALHGILLLETVNYIEHYGLQRRPTGDGRYERAMPEHSWNSNHIIGRVMLFELSRHSDHHYLASRKYQVLRHHENSPQMPTGYPGMMLLASVPPAWFYVMNRRVKGVNGEVVNGEWSMVNGSPSVEDAI
jgi:alkane 1-monooxygenase